MSEKIVQLTSVNAGAILYFSPDWECQKMASNGVQPLNDYTCCFRPSSLKCTNKSGLDGLQAGK